MDGRHVLMCGVAAVAGTVGYMVGGSASPVVSVAAPAVFGLVVTAMGLLQAGTPNKEFLSFVHELGERADTHPDVVEHRRRLQAAPAWVGWALIVFSLAYLSGATLGAKVRLDGWLRTRSAAQPFPWAMSGSPPPDISSALSWLALQARLQELGYDAQRVNELYAIQLAQWKAAGAGSSSGSAATDSGVNVKAGVSGAAASAPSTRTTEEVLRRWLESAPQGNPFANQPPRELTDKLKEIGRLPG